jgi:cation:H+ antiporter
VATWLAVLAFLVSLAATLMASEMLVWGLSRLGFKLGMAAGLLGLLTALGADSPEIASATSAVLSGAREVGVGVIIGSNLFNLAALFGLPGIISGRLPLSRTVAVLDGSANLLVTFVAVGMLIGLVSTAATVALFVVILVLYLPALALPPRSVVQLPLPPSVVRRLASAAEQIHPEEMVGQVLRAGTSWLPVWLVPPALIVIVAASVVMVMAAVLLGERWHVPGAVVGTVALAAITGLPNLYAAVRLARHGQGTTVVSEALNSNTFNLVVGLSVPAIVVGRDVLTSTVGPLLWLVGLSAAAIALTVWRGGLTRLVGAAIVFGYLAFLAFFVEGVL